MVLQQYEKMFLAWWILFNVQSIHYPDGYFKIQSNLDISNSDISEFCETRSVYLNQKYILIAFSNNNLALETFYESKLPEVQINLHFD